MQYSGEIQALFLYFAKLLAIIVKKHQKLVDMLQAIIGFHLDEEQHWVADLECGHSQHVRHTPPWQNRPWVMTKQGRKEKLGVMLECKKCQNQND